MGNQTRRPSAMMAFSLSICSNFYFWNTFLQNILIISNLFNDLVIEFNNKIMENKTKKLRFDLSGYYFFGLVLLVLLGFWPSYFAKFFNGSADFSYYFHFHAAVLILWMSLLIIQPILIRKKKLTTHRIIGKITYFIIPLIFISILLLTHSRLPHNGLLTENDLVGTFNSAKDLVILTIAFYIAIKFRNDYQLHARGMIVTGLAFIEPAFIRFTFRTISNTTYAYLTTIFTLYAVFLYLIYRERNQKSARWVFPFILVMYMIAHTLILTDCSYLPIWRDIVKWFASLPLTT